MGLIFKIMTQDQWDAFQKGGQFFGSPVDLADGYIHFSGPETVRETARKHFSRQEDLLLVGVEESALGAALKWEPSRGGALFPHLYAALDLRDVSTVEVLPLGPDGLHVFPASVP